MNILGISAGFHDAAITILNDNKIVFAGHSERYSKVKHDAHICPEILNEVKQYGIPDVISYYEKPLLKKSRQLFAGQWSDAFDLSNISVKQYLKQFDIQLWSPKTKFVHHSHHLSHAAAGFQTSPFEKATVVIIDAIGEWDTITIWGAEYINGKAVYKKLWSKWYPHSIGLFYSAMTQRVGLRPLDEEYILMGMAGYGKPKYEQSIISELIEDLHNIEFSENLHCGVEPDLFPGKNNEYDIATSTQRVTELLIDQIMHKAQCCNWSNNLVYSGGVALNCLANRNLGKWFDKIWIMPNPGDAGSSLGAAALSYGKRIDWQGPYLGTEITGPYPVDGVISKLLSDKIVGVASGRAEFGPRALGNRSLFADPRGTEIKDKVNEIKQRQKFRPFAPMILEEYVHEYFRMPRGFYDSPYMQAVATCRQPSKFPAIIHIDGTSRVQTVPTNSTSGVRQLLEKWYSLTGCPMLLNTSLNIRGEPMVNDRTDADRFQDLYSVPVLS
jgi:carbamoyltransferase